MGKRRIYVLGKETCSAVVRITGEPTKEISSTLGGDYHE